jgi:putative aminopeptidase FrvX
VLDGTDIEEITNIVDTGIPRRPFELLAKRFPHSDVTKIRDFSHDENSLIVKLAKKSLIDAGIEAMTKTMKYVACDGNTEALNSGLIKCITLGTGSKNIHTKSQSINIEDIAKMSLAVTAIIANACDLKIEKSS